MDEKNFHHCVLLDKWIWVKGQKQRSKSDKISYLKAMDSNGYALHRHTTEMKMVQQKFLTETLIPYNISTSTDCLAFC